MATGTNTFEGGTNGATVTNTNSGGASGTIATTVSIAAGDAIVYSNTAPAHELMGARMDFIAGGAGATRIVWNAAESGRLVFSFYYLITTLPTQVEDIAGIRHAAGNMCVLTIGVDGKIVVANASGTSIAASKSTNTIPINTMLRIDIAIKKGTTTTDGNVGYAYYLGSNSTPVFTWESTTENTGTADVAQVFIGRSTGRAQAHTIYYDTVRWNSPVTSGFMSPYTPPSGGGGGGATGTVINTFEGGTNNTTVTLANSGGVSGDTPSDVAIATGDGVVFSNTNPAHQLMGVKMTFLAGGAGATRIMWAAAESGRIVFSFYYLITTLPTATEDVAGIRHASGNMCVLNIGADGKLVVANAAGVNIAASKATNTIPINTMLRIDLAVQKGTTTTDGTVGYAYYLGSDSTPVFSWESSSQNTNTVDVAKVFIGRSTGRAEAHTVYYDTIRKASPLSSGYLAPYTPPSGGGGTTVLVNTFNGGTDGTTISEVNSGGSSGTAANLVSIAAGDTIVYSNFAPAHGSLSAEMNFLGPGAGATRIVWNDVQSGRLVFSFYYQLNTALPTATEDVAGVRNSTGNMCILTIGADGKLIMLNSAGTGISASRSTNTIPIQQNFRIDISCKKGTTTADGTIGYAYYLGSNSVPEFSWESATQNTGTTDTASFFVGRSTGRTQAHVCYYDTIRKASPLTSGFLAPFVPAATPPTITLGPDIVDIEPWDIVSIAANAFDNDGTVVNYVFNQTAGPTTVVLSGSGAVRTYTAPGLANGGTFSFDVTAYDNDGLSATDSVSHTVLAASEFSIASDGTFTPLQIKAVQA